MSDTMTELSPSQIQALSLTEVALALDKARLDKNIPAIDAILKRNQELWVAVRILAERSTELLPNMAKVNLHRLADFVVQACGQAAETVQDRLIDTLININLQISEGILEGEKKGLISPSLPTVEAFSLTEVAVALDVARQKNDAKALVVALERELEVWVAIKTMSENQSVNLSPALRANLTRLADFVADTIMKQGVKLGDSALDTLININFQISEGLLEGNRILATSEKTSLAMSDALNLVQTGLALDLARQKKDKKALVAALDANLQLWVAMKTMITRPELELVADTRTNIIRLADFVADVTMKNGADIGEEALDTLININFQIAEGLLVSGGKSAGATI